MSKIEYYSLNNILKINAQYYMIIGERSNGKTYSVLQYGLEEYVKNGSQLGIIRRWEVDIKRNKALEMWSSLVSNDEISKATKGTYNNVYWYNGSLVLCYFDKDKQEVTKRDSQPFCYVYALSLEEHYKGIAYPNIRNILFDEFLTRGTYLVDEFITFQNLLSTIIRLRTDVKIFMCANTINRYAPYFEEMGLNHVPYMKKGTIDAYDYGDSGLRVAVEYCDFSKNNKKKASNVYFAFNNPRLKMIRDGDWEIDIYPHLPVKYLPKHVVYYFFIEFADNKIRGDVVQVDQYHFIYFYPKTTPYTDKDMHHLIWSLKTHVEPNYRLYFKATGDIEQKILKYFQLGKVFYATNEVGEIINNFMNEQGIKLR